MPKRDLPPLESLLQHRRWVRDVARRLLRDEHAAEDLAQEAWTRALRSPPDPARDPRPWLRRVLKNLASNRRRADGRRHRRESAWREERVQGTPAELVAEAEQHKRLVGLVLALEEPFKTVLVLRFYEGLGPKTIAERLGIPVGTVHSRIARAVARLKTRLDLEEGGDRRVWTSALLPLAGAGPLAPAAATTASLLPGALLMSTKTLLVGATALFLSAALVLHLRAPDEDPALPPTTTGSQGEPPRLEGREEGVVPAADLLADLPAPVDLDQVDRTRDLHGVVVRAEDGAPVAGAYLRTVTYPWRRLGLSRGTRRDEESPGPSTRSARDGTFVLRLQPGSHFNLRVDAPGFAELELPGCNAGERLRVVLPRGVSLDVRVCDADGAPVAEARLRLRDRGSNAKDVRLERRARSGPEGRVRFDRLPGGRAVWLQAEHEVLGESKGGVLVLPRQGTLAQTLTFKARRGLSGRITDASSGEGLRGAEVSWGGALDPWVGTDAAGHYELPPRAGSGRRLSARAEGFALGRVLVGERELQDLALHPGTVLVGRVVSADGELVSGARMMGASVRKQGEASGADLGLEVGAGSDGRFRLPAVRSGAALDLVIWAPGHGRLVQRIKAERLTGGELDLGDVVLPERRVLAGVVRDTLGDVVTRARVTLGHLKRIPLYRHEGVDYGYGTHYECWTDDLGRFRFNDLMSGRFRLTVEPREQGAFFEDVRIPVGKDLEGLKLIMPQARSLRVVVVTDKGRPIAGVRVRVWEGNGVSARTADTDAAGVARLRLTGPALRVGLALLGELRGRYVGVLHKTYDVADREVRFVLWEGLPTRGRVVDPADQPLGGLYIQVQIDGEQADRRVTAADGSFTVTVPTGGATDLVVTGFANVPMDGGTRGAHLPLVGRLDGVKAGAQDLVLRVTRHESDRTLRLRVLLPSGEPAPEALVIFQPGPVGGFGHVQTDKQGRAELTGLAPLPMTLTTNYWSQDHPSLRVHLVGIVPAGQEVVLQFRKGRELTGWVLDADNQPLPMVTVTVKCASGSRHMTKSNPDGTFRFRLDPEAGERVTIEAVHTTRSGQHLFGTLKNVSTGSRDLRLLLESAEGR